MEPSLMVAMDQFAIRGHLLFEMQFRKLRKELEKVLRLFVSIAYRAMNQSVLSMYIVFAVNGVLRLGA